MKSYFEKKLALQSLRFSVDSSSKLLDMMLDDPQESEKLKGKFKNVCAMISQPLTERLEHTLDILDMSKREFLEGAIIDALDKAELIMQENGVYDSMQSHSVTDKGEAA